MIYKRLLYGNLICNWCIMNKVYKLLYMILFFWVFLVGFISADILSEFKQEMEGKVTKLAEQMTNIYKGRCNSNILNCDIKSINSCEGTDQKICHEDFLTSPSCLSNGAYLSQNSGTRFPNDVVIQQLTDQQKNFVCTSATMESTFHELDQNRNGRYGLAYIGTVFGSTRSYPAIIQTQGGQCRDYDPRFRPWYVTAASGGKNVIMIIDISESMKGSKIQMAKQAAKNVVNTLSNSDFIGIVTFSTGANYLLGNKILRATYQYKNQLISAIDKLEVNGGTNYQVAFTLGFSMLEAAEKDQFGSPCINSQNVMLFLTDGYPGQGATSLQGLIDVINSLNKFNIKLFTYGLSYEIDTRILQGLSCQYNGFMFLIQDDNDIEQLPKIMRSYYIYLSEGINVVRPAWTEPYDDYFGFGRLITVSIPIYYYQGTIRKILGVAGIDVSVKYLQELGLQNETQIMKFALSGTTCYNNSLSACQLQQLRETGAKCSISGCPATQTISVCSQQTTTDIFIPGPNNNQQICCGLSVGDTVGIVIGGVIFLHIFFGSIAALYYFQFKKSKMRGKFQSV